MSVFALTFARWTGEKQNNAVLVIVQTPNKMFYFHAFYFTVFGIAVWSSSVIVAIGIAFACMHRGRTIGTDMMDISISTHSPIFALSIFAHPSHIVPRCGITSFEVCSPWSIQIKRSYGSITHVSCMQIARQNCEQYAKNLPNYLFISHPAHQKCWCGCAVISISDLNFSTIARLKYTYKSAYEHAVIVFPSFYLPFFSVGAFLLLLLGSSYNRLHIFLCNVIDQKLIYCI